MSSYWHLITNYFNPLSLQAGYWYVDFRAFLITR